MSWFLLVLGLGIWFVAGCVAAACVPAATARRLGLPLGIRVRVLLLGLLGLRLTAAWAEVVGGLAHRYAARAYAAGRHDLIRTQLDALDNFHAVTRSAFDDAGASVTGRRTIVFAALAGTAAVQWRAGLPPLEFFALLGAVALLTAVAARAGRPAVSLLRRFPTAMPPTGLSFSQKLAQWLHGTLSSAIEVLAGVLLAPLLAWKLNRAYAWHMHELDAALSRLPPAGGLVLAQEEHLACDTAMEVALRLLRQSAGIERAYVLGRWRVLTAVALYEAARLLQRHRAQDSRLSSRFYRLDIAGHEALSETRLARISDYQDAYRLYRELTERDAPSDATIRFRGPSGTPD